MRPSEMIDSAVAVREELDRLVGPDADALRAELDDLLGSALDEDELADRLRRLLETHQGTRQWLRSREAYAESVPPLPAQAPPEPAAPPAPAPDAGADYDLGPGVDAGIDADEDYDLQPLDPSSDDGIDVGEGGVADDDLLGAGDSEEGGAPPGRTAFPRIDAPGEVVVGIEFEITVGLRPDADPTVYGSPLQLPSAPVTVGVHVTADGIEVAPGHSWRHELRVEPDEPYPTATLKMIPQPGHEPVREARIQALFTIAGQAIGFGSRAVNVVADRSLVTGRAPDQPEPSIAAALDVRTISPDLTVWLRKGITDGELLWAFATPAGLPLPDAPLKTTIGTDAKSFAKFLVAKVNGLDGKPNLYRFLQGVSREIADHMPQEFFDLLGAVAQHIGRRPLVQLLTEEPYVPWELAWLDVPLDPELPQYLGAQAVVGRWITGTRRPKSPPPAQAEGTAMAVVSGIYDKVPGWNRLVAAEEEAAELTERYGASSVDATLNPVLKLLDGDPDADVLHFAVHGNYDQSGGMDGLVLVDREIVDPFSVGGKTFRRAPFVFLNACQVGSSQAILGDYAGLAAAFLKAGACAVVAPLWSVKDTIAKELALSFYERVRDGAAPAEVLRSERATASQDEGASATAFAYQFFGHPAMTIDAPSEEDP